MVLVTAEQVAVGYRLPVVEILPTAQENRVVGHLGPDVLGDGWDLDRAVANLHPGDRLSAARPTAAGRSGQHLADGGVLPRRSEPVDPGRRGERS
ncbi:hypothetical protein FMEAI12_2860009 [Parafrankia sp. Ea1.12]|nr:hypothetical protein FMEAI12_2860009 [Parafrankia sp. Ea1.12]